mmetsp:Transcript_26703/g.84743  ORF Transcript_26703/g.84743 Transcript_26703/m.84743 type:complete len:551 (-) Transcript_26703:320-1972(-)
MGSSSRQRHAGAVLPGEEPDAHAEQHTGVPVLLGALRQVQALRAAPELPVPHGLELPGHRRPGLRHRDGAAAALQPAERGHHPGPGRHHPALLELRHRRQLLRGLLRAGHRHHAAQVHRLELLQELVLRGPAHRRDRLGAPLDQRGRRGLRRRPGPREQGRAVPARPALPPPPAGPEAPAGFHEGADPHVGGHLRALQHRQAGPGDPGHQPPHRLLLVGRRPARVRGAELDAQLRGGHPRVPVLDEPALVHLPVRRGQRGDRGREQLRARLLHRGAPLRAHRLHLAGEQHHERDAPPPEPQRPGEAVLRLPALLPGAGRLQAAPAAHDAVHRVRPGPADGQHRGRGRGAAEAPLRAALRRAAEGDLRQVPRVAPLLQEALPLPRGAHAHGLPLHAGHHLPGAEGRHLPGAPDRRAHVLHRGRAPGVLAQGRGGGGRIAHVVQRVGALDALALRGPHGGADALRARLRRRRELPGRDEHVPGHLPAGEALRGELRGQAQRHEGERAHGPLHGLHDHRGPLALRLLPRGRQLPARRLARPPAAHVAAAALQG